MTRRTPPEVRLRIEREETRLLLEDRKFRRFLWRLLAQSDMFGSSHRGNPSDASFKEGRRTLGLELLDELRVVRPDALHIILAEYPAWLPGKLMDAEPETPGEADD